jgi:hypothetical protein
MGGFVIQHYLLNGSVKIKSATLLCSVPSHGLWRLIGNLIFNYPLSFLQSILTFSWLPVLKKQTRLHRIMFRLDIPKTKLKHYATLLKEESFLAFLQMVLLYLPKISINKVPIMIIGGEKDFLIPKADTIRMANRYKVEPFIVSGASHCLMLEEGWEEVATKIYSFIK